MPEPRNERGDPEKRKCEFYACCQNLRDERDDESGVQLKCAICGAAIFVPADDLAE